MSDSGPSSMRARERDGLNGLAGAFRLAKEMERKRLSYPLSGLFLLIVGFLLVPGLSGVLELRGFGVWEHRVEEFYNVFFLDCMFLGVCALLAVNAVSGGHALGRRSVFSWRLLLSRRLPVSARSLVSSRAVSLLFALVLNVPAFFLPVFLLSEIGELGISYVWFAGTWIGYSLLISGLYLLLELTANGRARASISAGCALSLLVLAILEWTLELNLVGTTVELAKDYGPLPAVLSILGGCAAFAILCRATVHLVRSRDISGGFSQ
jgi:hypothetical protein